MRMEVLFHEQNILFGNSDLNLIGKSHISHIKLLLTTCRYDSRGVTKLKLCPDSPFDIS